MSDDKIMETEKYELPEIMANYEDPYAVIQPILDDIHNPAVHGFHYILAGGRTQGKRQLNQKIFEELEKAGKLTAGARPQEISINRVSTTDLKPGRFYIITDVYSKISEETKKKLGRPLGDCYVIVVADEAIAAQFVDLTENIRFYFKDKVIHIPDFSIRDYFYGYSRLLDPKLNMKLNYHADPDFDSEKFHQEFADYIATNEPLIPIKNRELVKYLADYANQQGELVLPPSLYVKTSPRQIMANFIGMEKVKSTLNDFENMMIFRKRAEIEGYKLPESFMHMMFLGNPGTGKTTVAKLIGEMLFSLGILKSSKVVETTPGDMCGNYVSDGVKNARAKIKEALGGVLIIDEAYSFNEHRAGADQGAQAIAELIKAMEEYKDQLVVILAGYEKETKALLKINPGLKSRIGYTFLFEDYNAGELQEMYRRKMTKAGFRLEDDALKKVLKVSDYFSKTKDFGNGRFVDNLMAETIRTHSKRELKDEDLMLITEADIPNIEDFAGASGGEHKNYEEALKNIVGLEQVKKQMENFASSVKFQVAAEKAGLKIPTANRHMLFLGNPGTGKTTVARITADMLYDMGVTHSRRLVEVERKDLIGLHVGETAPKTYEKVEEALGGVLFIDEAYSLADDAGSEHGYGSECITTLVKAMEDHKDDLIVIFAGYKREMAAFVNANPGIASRIGFSFDFEDYDPEELTEIFRLKISASGFRVQDEVYEKVQEVMQYFCHVENFGNGRFVDKFITLTIDKHSRNYLDTGNVDELVIEDVPTIEEMIKGSVGGENMIDPLNVTDEEKYRIAVHELGHALLQLTFFPEAKIEKITVNAEGTGALGYVQHQNSFKNQNTKSDFINMIAVKMAGIASEELILGEFADGGSADIDSARALAEHMIAKLGMSESGFVYTGSAQQNNEVSVLVTQGFCTAKAILEDFADLIEEKASVLVEQGILDASELMEEYDE